MAKKFILKPTIKDKNDLSIDQIDIVYNNQNNKIKEANEDLKNL